jgi:hypothetical protein
LRDHTQWSEGERAFFDQLISNNTSIRLQEKKSIHNRSLNFLKDKEVALQGKADWVVTNNATINIVSAPPPAVILSRASACVLRCGKVSLLTSHPRVVDHIAAALAAALVVADRIEVDRTAVASEADQTVVVVAAAAAAA